MRLYTTPRFAPLPDTQRINWPTVADELHARPGEWAAVGTQDCGRHPLNRDKLAGLGLECTSRSNGDGTWTIWMRGVGGWQPERVQPSNPAPPSAPTLGDIARSVFADLAPAPATFKWFRGERRTVQAAA